MTLSFLNSTYEYRTFCSKAQRPFPSRPQPEDKAKPEMAFGEPLRDGDIWLHRTQRVDELTGLPCPASIATWVYFENLPRKGSDKMGGWVRTSAREGCPHPTKGLRCFRLKVMKNMRPKWSTFKGWGTKHSMQFAEELLASGEVAIERLIRTENKTVEMTLERLAQDQTDYEDQGAEFDVGMVARSRSRPRARTSPLAVAASRHASVTPARACARDSATPDLDEILETPEPMFESPPPSPSSSPSPQWIEAMADLLDAELAASTCMQGDSLGKSTLRDPLVSEGY